MDDAIRAINTQFVRARASEYWAEGQPLAQRELKRADFERALRRHPQGAGMSPAELDVVVTEAAGASRRRAEPGRPWATLAFTCKSEGLRVVERASNGR